MSTGKIGASVGRSCLLPSRSEAGRLRSPKDRFFACFSKRPVSTASITVLQEEPGSTTEPSRLLQPNEAASSAENAAPKARSSGRGKQRQPIGENTIRSVYPKSIRRVAGTNRRQRPFLSTREAIVLRKILDDSLQEAQKNEFVVAKQKSRRFNRDYLLEKGPLAYDWRIPFAQLRRYISTPDNDRRTPDHLEVKNDRKFLDAARANHTHYKSVRAEDIPIPEVMSRKAFGQYVYDLVNSEVPSIHTRKLYGESRDHRTAVRDRLMELFDDSAMVPFFSRTAFNTAMSFLHRRSFVSDSRHLFNRMSDERFSPSRDTYHIIFRDVARKKNLHAFAILLRTMVKRLIPPDATTWQFFFQCLDSKLVKTLVYEHMKSLNLLQDLSILRTVTTELIVIDSERHIERGGRLSDLIFEYDQRFGQKWFSTSAANNLCHTLSLHGRLRESFDLLELLAQRGCKPDQATLRILLLALRRLGKGGNIYGAIEVVRILNTNYGLELDANMFEILFLMGWNLYRPNWCRAVWQVACLKAEVSHKMSVMVMKGLTFQPDGKTELTRYPHFLTYGAKIVAGVDGPEPVLKIDSLPGLDNGSSLNGQKEKIIEMAKQVRNGDFDKSFDYDYDGDFASLLKYAVELDKQWVADGRYKAGELDWMLREAVKVPRVKRKQTMPLS